VIPLYSPLLGRPSFLYSSERQPLTVDVTKTRPHGQHEGGPAQSDFGLLHGSLFPKELASPLRLGCLSALR